MKRETHESTNTKYRINFTQISISTLCPFRLQPPLCHRHRHRRYCQPPHIFPVCGDFILSSSINKYLFSFLYKHRGHAIYSCLPPCLPTVFIYFISTKSIVDDRHTSIKNGEILILLVFYPNTHVRTHTHTHRFSSPSAAMSHLIIKCLTAVNFVR